MGVKKQNHNKLNRQEQATTATYKLMCEKVNNLEKSLRKTQDESEKIRVEKHELENKYFLLENKFTKHIFIEILKFLSSGALGFAINYFTSGNVNLALSIGIPSILIFSICIYFTKK